MSLGNWIRAYCQILILIKLMEILPVTSNGPDIILRANSYEIIPVQTQSISTDFSGASLDLLIQPKQSWSWSLKSEASTGKSQFSVKLTATKGCSFFFQFCEGAGSRASNPRYFLSEPACSFTAGEHLSQNTRADQYCIDQWPGGGHLCLVRVLC